MWTRSLTSAFLTKARLEKACRRQPMRLQCQTAARKVEEICPANFAGMRALSASGGAAAEILWATYLAICLELEEAPHVVALVTM